MGAMGGAGGVGPHLTPCLTLVAFSSHVIGFGSLHPHFGYCLLTFFLLLVCRRNGWHFTNLRRLPRFEGS